MKVTSEIVCPGCKLKTKVGFKRPGLFSPALFQFTCTSCTSLVMAKVEAPKAKKGQPVKPGQVKVAVKLVRASQVLVDMLKEEAEHNASVEEDAGGAVPAKA